MSKKNIIKKVNELNYENKTDKELKEMFFSLKNNKNKIIKQLAVSKEIIKRTTSLVLFDVQLLGALALLEGNIIEMKTGEGKTIVAILTSLLRYLEGGKTHIVTVNDYLAQRDGEYAKLVYDFLDLRVDYIITDTKNRKDKYDNADTLYITNSELGFDYLRSNGAYFEKDVLFNIENTLVIVDEADSVLIDEAKIPLILSAPKEYKIMTQKQVNSFIEKIKSNNKFYEIELKDRNAFLTADGCKKAEEFFGLKTRYSDKENSNLRHIVKQSLVAHLIMKKDKDYIVRDGQVLLIDQSTGRIADGRRYNRGLHQAIEAKEKVEIQDESISIATITYQNLFKMYSKLSGMTGTAMSEKKEFKEIYNLNVVEIPTNKPVIRKDDNDLLFANNEDRNLYLLNLIKQENSKHRPILIGTNSIENSEKIAKVLTENGYKIQILNAKNHAKEAEIIAQAGQKDAITVATNMAGRGTDIKLGEGVKELGGLLLIGIGHYENIRIDNQFRGRSGRQGDPGESIFLVSMDDELVNIFAAEYLKNVIRNLTKAQGGKPIENNSFSKAIKKAQYQIQIKNFNQRKSTIEFDEILGIYRDLYYNERMRILRENNIEYIIKNILKIKGLVKIDKYVSTKIKEQILINMDRAWVEFLSASEDLKIESNYLSFAGTKPITIYEKELADYYKIFLDSVKESVIKLFNIKK